MGSAARLLVVCAVLAIGCVPTTSSPPGIGGVTSLTDPAEGWSIHMPAFEVPPGTEVQDCFFAAVPDLNGDGSDIWVDRFVIAQRTGSHHMNVFRVNSIIDLDGVDGELVRGGECRISTNWADWPLVVNSQDGAADRAIVDWQLPDGVAQRFRPGELLMVQAHYVNADLQTSPDGGEVMVNFHRSPLADPIEMGTLFATQQSIRVCRSQPRVTFDGACGFAPEADVETFHIAAANGHFHSRGQSFRMYPWDGQSLQHPDEATRFYESVRWDEPPMLLDLDIQIPGTGGIWWDCDYQWQEPPQGCDAVDALDPLQAGDCCYSFGSSAEFSEHCNVFAYYWPKTEHIACN